MHTGEFSVAPYPVLFNFLISFFATLRVTAKDLIHVKQPSQCTNTSLTAV